MYAMSRDELEIEKESEIVKGISNKI